MLDLFFPHRLRRLGYFLRTIPLNIFILGGLMRVDVATPPSMEDNLFNIGTVLLALYVVFFVYLPRVRDCGLPPWSLVLGLIPYVSSAYGVLLLFKRSRLSYFDTPPAETTPEPITIAGSTCGACGKSLLFATDGVVTASRKVLCHTCQARAGDGTVLG